MISDEAQELLAGLGGMTSGVHFRKIPDDSILMALCEGNPELEIFLPLSKDFRLNEDGPESYMSNIVSAAIRSDIYSDWGALQHYENLQHLVLTCTNQEASYIHTDDLSEMQLAIVNLVNLKTLVIRMEGMKETAVKQITEGLSFPMEAFQVTYEVKKARKRKSTEQPASL